MLENDQRHSPKYLFCDRTFVYALTASLVTVAGCDQPAVERGLTSDSRTTPMWFVASTPSLETGADDEQPGRELLRVAGAMRVADGSLIVASAGTSDIRMFASSGAWLRKIGQAGNGPGDFKLLIGV